MADCKLKLYVFLSVKLLWRFFAFYSFTFWYLEWPVKRVFD